ncbi:hypothetical protein [Actinomycetospora atypica]|uniref:Zinc-finger domain-containing protein n=1 Tax=Actinomycetospora atypica TaxID=1290095 RepID=A0ABV9YJ97_9PSEU
MIGPQASAWARWRDGGHLSLDAVVAHVDGELPPGAAARATAHVDHCLTCAGEVAAQRQARRRLRAADCPGVPSSLLSSLRAIPDSAELPEAPAGLAVDAQGRFVVPAGSPTRRSGHGGRWSRRRVLPAVVASGLVVGAAAVVGPVVAAGAAPASVVPVRAPSAGASLTAAVPVPVAGERGNPVIGAVVERAGRETAVTSTTPVPGPDGSTPTRPPA